MVATTATIGTYVDYGVAGLSKFGTTVSTNPSAMQKTGKLILKAIELFSQLSLPTGTTAVPKLVQHLQGADTIFGLFDFVSTVNFWLNPFKMEKVDQKAFTSSLKEALLPYAESTEDKEGKTLEQTEAIVKEVMTKGKDFKIQKEAVDALKQALKDRNYSDAEIEAIADQTRIAMKPRKDSQVLAAIYFTMSGVGGILSKFQEWDILHLGQLACQIGSKAPVFAFITQVSLKSITMAASGIGLSITFIASIRRAYKMHEKLSQATDEKKIEKYTKERTRALWTSATSGVGLIVMAIPLIVSLSPPVVTGLAIASTAIGLVSIFAKP